MKNLWIFIFITLISCKENSTRKQQENSRKLETDSINSMTNGLEESDSLIKKENNSTSVIYKNNKTAYELVSDTLVINSKNYIVGQKDSRSEEETFLFILNEKNDTIYKHNGYATNGFEFEDFDNDGVLDIRLYQITNVGGISELIMFDKLSSSFRAVENFDNFPQPTKIENTKYWYSYHKSGCADINWGSELYKIENFVAIEIGDIKGIGCDGEEENGIFVFKVNGEKREKIYSEKREPGYYNDKWDFIAKYWTNNHTKFQ